jgi:hypothetical protein
MAKRFVLYVDAPSLGGRLYVCKGAAKWVRLQSLAQTFVMRSVADRAARKLNADARLVKYALDVHVEQVQW